MAWLAIVVADLLMAVQMIRRYREDRRRGVVIDWRRTFIVVAGILAVTLLGLVVLILSLNAGQDVVGVILFFIVVGGGLVAIARAANRIWPPTAPQ